MSFSYWHQHYQKQTDILIVGGGIAGLSIAYWLGKLMPKKKVLLIEALHVGAGATGRNAGFLLQGTAANFAMEIEQFGYEKAKRLWEISRENIRLLKQEAPKLVQQTGSYQLAGSLAEFYALQRSAELLNWDGFKAKCLSEKQIQRKLGTAHFFGGLFLPENAQTHSIALVEYLRQKAKAEVREGRSVAQIDGNTAILEDGTTIVAETLICTLNAYLPILLPEWKDRVFPVRAQMLAATLANELALNTPVYSHEGYFYIREVAPKQIILGGARHLHSKKEVGYEDKVTDVLQADLAAYLKQYFPKAVVENINNRWSGTMGFTPSGLPIFCETAPQQFALGGFNGHGMGYAFYLGKQVALKLLGEQTPDLNLFGT